MKKKNQAKNRDTNEAPQNILDASQRESIEKYKNILENTQEAYFEVDLAGNFTFFNQAFCRILGYSLEEMMGMNYKKYADQENAKIVFQTYNTIYKTGKPAEAVDWQFIRKDGTKIYVDQFVSLHKDSSGKITGFKGFVRDVTERKKTEDNLRRSEKMYSNLVDTIPDAVLHSDLNGDIIFVNNHTLKISGYSRDDLVGKNILNFISPEYHDTAFKNISLMIEGKLKPLDPLVEYQLIMKNGTKRFFEVNSDILTNEDGTPFGVVYLCRDMTERKKTEEDLKKNETQYRLLADNISEHIWLMDLNTLNTIYVSPSVEKMYGYRLDEIKNLSLRKILTKESFKKMVEAVSMELPKAIATPAPHVHKYSLELEACHKDGHHLWIDNTVSYLRDENGKIALALGETRDITERKQAEDSLKASERRYRLLADNVTDIIFTMDMNLRFTYISPSVKLVLGYTPEETMTRKLQETVSPGTFNYLKNVLLEEVEIEKHADRILRGPRVIEYQHIHKNGSEIWMEATLTFLRDKNRNAVGILGIVRDISRRKQAEMALANTLENLRKALGTTIQVMVSAVEMKDPYTAGHQIRTSEIATAIAREMGLPNDTVDGIRMAGSIHDIGKLSVPTEILSKPTKLTTLEFSLIKEHSKSGFEILKNVESPWPLAEIVHQHHERMDGSGYPRKLKGNDIILEARIMAVSDVVEAMASHRPYRAALGIDVALEEIEKNRGISYDEDVVDACLRLFREKDYRLA